MKIFDLIATCTRNLTRRKFRTFLTVIGVVIGTASIVVMISLSNGISARQDEMFASLGDLTIINVYSQGASAESALDDDTVEMMQNMPGVVVATPFMRYWPPDGSMNLYAGRGDRYHLLWANIYGVKLEALEILGYTVAEGKMLGEADDNTVHMLFGKRVAYYFRDTRRRSPNDMIDEWAVDEYGNAPDPFFDPMEMQFSLNLLPYKEGAKELKFNAEVVGILGSDEREWDKPMMVIMDIEQMKRLQLAYEREAGIRRGRNSAQTYDEVKVKVEDIKQVGEVEAAITDMGFYAYSMGSWREEMQQATAQIQLILAILGGVSLFVAAISITNTMIMSVYERTREIGVMKVLGCLVGNIRTMFLVEAGMIGFIGGVAGILLSYLISFLLNTFGGSLGQMFGGGMGGDSKVSIIPLSLVLLGLVFSTLIGIISGFLPANRAVKISALEAIRTE